MLEVVKFTNGRYGIRNVITGVVLTKSDDTLITFRTSRGALRRIRALDRELIRIFRPRTVAHI